MHRLVTIAVVLLLAGCGFRLREDVVLPETLDRMRVETVDPFSPLGRDIARVLERIGVEVTDAEGAAVLAIPVDRLYAAPLTVGDTGRVQEYVLRYVTEVEVRAADGAVVMPRQRIELSRDYTFDAVQALGSPGEEEVVREELQREMVQAILRRVQAAVR